MALGPSFYCPVTEKPKLSSAELAEVLHKPSTEEEPFWDDETTARRTLGDLIRATMPTPEPIGHTEQIPSKKVRDPEDGPDEFDPLSVHEKEPALAFSEGSDDAASDSPTLELPEITDTQASQKESFIAKAIDLRKSPVILICCWLAATVVVSIVAGGASGILGAYLFSNGSTNAQNRSMENATPSRADSTPEPPAETESGQSKQMPHEQAAAVMADEHSEGSADAPRPRAPEPVRGEFQMPAKLPHEFELPLTFDSERSTPVSVDEDFLRDVARAMIANRRLHAVLIGQITSVEANQNRSNLGIRRAKVTRQLLRANGPSRRRFSIAPPLTTADSEESRPAVILRLEQR